VYIDAFAGAGMHISRTTRDFVPGSPLNALQVQPQFREYFLIDIKPDRVAHLRQLVGDRRVVHVLEGDCNNILLTEVFPNVQYRDFRRGLCLLDPYGLHLSWEIMATAGTMQSIEMFLNFPVADMNRNVFWKTPDRVDAEDIARMNAFWGDDSWRQVVYSNTGNLFGYDEKAADNETIAQAFRQRLKTRAAFKHVPDPLPMRNSIGAVVYYLFFASQNATGARIATDIFKKYRRASGR
jgi:three-Cys-motif partner protein